jgi:hypothetical protein
MMNKPAPTLATVRAYRDEILALAERYGAYNVRVFGSVARGDATENSDIDLLVQFQPWVSLYELVGIKQAIEGVLNQPVDIVEDHAGLRECFRDRIMRDAVML